MAADDKKGHFHQKLKKVFSCSDYRCGIWGGGTHSICNLNLGECLWWFLLLEVHFPSIYFTSLYIRVEITWNIATQQVTMVTEERKWIIQHIINAFYSDSTCMKIHSWKAFQFAILPVSTKWLNFSLHNWNKILYGKNDLVTHWQSCSDTGWMLVGTTLVNFGGILQSSRFPFSSFTFIIIMIIY